MGRVGGERDERRERRERRERKRQGEEEILFYPEGLTSHPPILSLAALLVFYGLPSCQECYNDMAERGC